MKYLYRCYYAIESIVKNPKYHLELTKYRIMFIWNIVPALIKYRPYDSSYNMKLFVDSLKTTSKYIRTKARHTSYIEDANNMDRLIELFNNEEREINPNLSNKALGIVYKSTFQVRLFTRKLRRRPLIYPSSSSNNFFTVSPLK